MPKPITQGIELKYGFPLFTQNASTAFLVSGEKLRVSDIWGLWHYIIKRYKKCYPSTNYTFLLSLVEQSQYFYIAAATAPLKSQPLLYYYSFLNIAKVFITLRNPSLETSGLEYNHGIDSCTIDKNSKLRSAYVQLKSLIDSTGNKQKISVAYTLSRELGDNIEQSIPPVPGINMGPWKFNIKSLFQACIGIHRTVSESFKENEQFSRLQGSTLWKTGRQLNFQGELYISEKVRNNLISAGYDIEFDNESNTSKVNFKYTATSSKIKKQDYLFHAQIINDLGIWHYNTNDENRMYVSPMAFSIKPGDSEYTLNPRTGANNYIRLSSATIIYYIMFFLGSITRYHPYMFESILSDKDIWMIGEFLKTQPYQYMNILLSKLLSTPILGSRMPLQYE